jgi:hypothetical protein
MQIVEINHRRFESVHQENVPDEIPMILETAGR